MVSEALMEDINEEKPLIQHAGENLLISDCAKEIANNIKDKDIIFFRNDTQKIVKVYENEGLNNFTDMTASSFISLIEKYMTPFVIVKTKDDFKQVTKSIPEVMSKTIINSDEFQDNLKKINTILPIQIPIIHQGKLTVPKIGYDPRFKTWLANDTPEITNPHMPIEEAKEIIDFIMKDFCFETEGDRVRAIAGLLTPLIKGLSKSDGILDFRTPLWIYEANRERAGKDYLSGITGILYEGFAVEEQPLCDNSNNGEETRKKITAGLMAGKFRMHFANNKGHLDNAFLESAITSIDYSDRLLGTTNSVKLKNNIEYSLSCNVGMTYTADISNRARVIKLFLEVENANDREFTTPDLWGYVKENRSKILSALYSFVNHWVENGMNEGSKRFSSFKEWARICGGIMESVGYGSPCTLETHVSDDSGDLETRDIKYLYDTLYKSLGSKEFKMEELYQIILEQKMDIFPDLNFTMPRDKKIFGRKFMKFIGRILSDIKLNVNDIKLRSRDRFFWFSPVGSRIVVDFINKHGSISEEDIKLGKLDVNKINNLVSEKFLIKNIDGSYSPNPEQPFRY